MNNPELEAAERAVIEAAKGKRDFNDGPHHDNLCAAVDRLREVEALANDPVERLIAAVRDRMNELSFVGAAPVWYHDIKNLLAEIDAKRAKEKF